MKRAAAIALALAGCATAPKPGFVAVYSWQVKAGCEDDFVRAWRAETDAFRERWGSLGTRLHRDDAGDFVATAFWPSRDAWARAHERAVDVPWAEAINERCIERKVDELHLEVVEDRAR